MSETKKFKTLHTTKNDLWSTNSLVCRDPWVLVTFWTPVVLAQFLCLAQSSARTHVGWSLRHYSRPTKITNTENEQRASEQRMRTRFFETSNFFLHVLIEMNFHGNFLRFRRPLSQGYGLNYFGLYLSKKSVFVMNRYSTINEVNSATKKFGEKLSNILFETRKNDEYYNK